jgi:peroxiredoxin
LIVFEELCRGYSKVGFECYAVSRDPDESPVRKMSAKNKIKNSLLTPGRVAFTVLVLSLFAAFGISSCNSRDERRANPISKSGPNGSVPPAPNLAPAALANLPASITDAELKAVSGAPIKLSSYAGKVYLVNLWATWCGPCRQETPELVKLHKEFQSQGVEVIGLSTENPEASADSVREFIRNYNVDYRVGWASQDVAIALMQGRDAIPQSFVISRTGRIVKRFVGFNPVATPPQIRAAIQEALSDKGAAD